MLHNTPFIQSFMAHYDYPPRAVRLFTEILQKLDDNAVYGKIFDDIREKFRRHKCRIDDKLLLELSALGRAMGIYHPYSVHFVFLLSLTEELHTQYALMGIDEKIYYDTMADLKYKLLECISVKGVAGTFVASWFGEFFRLERVCYGRFQYETGRFNTKEFRMKCGKILKPDDLVVGFHIPSSGVSLTDEVRLASYKQAYKHLSPLFPDGIVIFNCGSWLLYPRHREFLPQNSNILRFMDDFEIVSFEEKKDFHDAWRIFGKDAKLPPSKLPRDTALRKAYAEWLEAGNKAGGGHGVIAFDGEKILK